MKHAFFIALASATLLAGVPAAAQQVVPVTFAKGKSSATVSGSIKGDQDRTYTVDARAGQTLKVTLKSTKGGAEMNVWAPGNDTALTVGAVDPYNFTTSMPANGRYRIQVYQMRASARRGETANYTLTIAITGAAPKASSDALVPGTKYNATATVSCVPGPGAPTGGCKAGVIRKGGGNAVVELQTPDGGQRSIIFTGGKATGSNATGARLTATRNGDITTVRLSTGEVYYIPDALVVGG
jgi:hypothetical protein